MNRKATFKNNDNLNDTIQIIQFGQVWIVEWSRHVNKRYISHEESFYNEDDAWEYYLNKLQDISRYHKDKPIIK